MKRIVQFKSGYDCINFECIHDSENCFPGSGGSHGLHGLDIIFTVKGSKGAIQFCLSTDWTPKYTEKSKIGTRDIFNWGIPNKVGAFSYPYPANIEIHSKKPLYEGHSITVNSCDCCDGSPCYCDISGLKANDAMYALVNGGDTALWQFLEDYYKAVFKGKEYPEPAEYKKPLRKSKS
jgi:hypothetical protein